jgi:hypothetical protein
MPEGGFMSHRDYARQQLELIKLALEAGKPLSSENCRYLLEVCELGLVDDQDPLGIQKPAGIDDSMKSWAALEVWRLMESGKTLDEAAGEVLTMIFRGKDSIEKYYKQFLPSIRAAELIYTARKEQRQLTPDEALQVKEDFRKAVAEAKKRNSRTKKRSSPSCQGKK